MLHRLPVLGHELAVPRLRPSHRHHQCGVERDQRRARNEVHGDDAEPVVDVEVGVDVRHQVRPVLADAADHGRVPELRRQLDGREAHLDEPAQLEQNGDDVDGGNGAQRVLDGAPAVCFQRPADVDVALGGQSHRQPDGCRVEYSRQVVGEEVESGAPAVRQPVAVRPVAARVEPEVGRQGTDAGQGVGDGHADQKRVGGAAHVRSDEDDADADVGQQGYSDEDRRHDPVDQHHVRKIVQLHQCLQLRVVRPVYTPGRPLRGMSTVRPFHRSLRNVDVTTPNNQLNTRYLLYIAVNLVTTASSSVLHIHTHSCTYK